MAYVIGLLAFGSAMAALAAEGAARGVLGATAGGAVTPVPLPPEPGAARGAHTLLVGSYHGIKGQYSDLQKAINAARPGDWILIGPGEYRERGNVPLPGAKGDDRAGAAVVVSKPNIHIRGMNRNQVWLDGTTSGPRCSRKTADQNFGPKDSAGNPSGRNGLVVYKVTGVSVENLSACNFLSGDLTLGDQIWFDGGGSSGKQTTMSFRGSYLTASSSYFVDQNSPSAQYGIYSSNTAGGPGVLSHDYASNFSDSAFYVGACPQCAVTVDAVHAQNSPEGYSGTNSGGVVIENSEFDQNRDGFDTNSQNNDDAPSPQTGACPGGAVNPHPPANIQRLHSCWVFENNYVHDNNNANVPAAGVVYNIPTGDGLTITGGRYDIVTHNRFDNNGAWGIYLIPYPDMETPPSDVGTPCQGGTYVPAPGNETCYYDDFGNEIANNTFTHDGFFGNPTNGDIADVSGSSPNSSSDSNCFHDNVDTAGTLTSQPANVDSYNQCGQTYMGEPITSPVFLQFACAAEHYSTSCPSGVGGNYPTDTGAPMTLPPPQPTMPNPCAGVPPNAWCQPTSRCVSGHTAVIHVAGAGQFVALRVTANGQRVRAHLKGRNGVVVKLGGRAGTSFTVRVVARLQSGATRVTERHLRTCPRAL